MRKMILMAIAGYLWKKYKARDGHTAHTAHTATGTGPAATATPRPSAPT